MHASRKPSIATAARGREPGLAADGETGMTPLEVGAFELEVRPAG